MQRGSPLANMTVLTAFALSGAAALVYEVIWTRSLSIVLGSTTHALASMLATFMLGLAIGGFAGGRLADRGSSTLRYAALCELGIGALGIGTMFLIPSLPSAYLAIYRATHLSETAYFTMQIALCSAVMLLPTVLMGMTFPLITRVLTDGSERVGSAVGRAYGANTLGSVAGSLLAGFVLVPGLGIRGATLAAAAANLSVGMLFLARARSLRVSWAAAPLAVFLALGGLSLAVPEQWTFVSFYTANRYLATGHDVVAEERRRLHPVFVEDGQDGRVSAFRHGRTLVLQVGGKIEGTAPEDLPNTLLLAYLPIAAHRDARSVLVVGLGAGVTLEAARRSAPHVELVEINAGVLRAVRSHGPPQVLDGIAVHRDDARNFLLRTEQRYDVISSEPSYPTEFAVANLFSRDYFAIASERLNEGGIYCQWLPYYMLTNDDVTMLVKTFGSVFAHTSIWKIPGSMDLLLLGSARPFAWEEASIRERVAALHPGGPPLEFVLSKTPAQVAEIVRLPDVPVNTDDRPILEFRVARNLRIGDRSLFER